MKVFDAKPSFAGGELAPTLYARVDLAQYAVGARVIENFIVLPQGGLVNRPGTYVIDAARVYSEVRLVPFVFSEDDSFCLAFADGYVDMYKFDERMETITGSPYSATMLPKLRWLQSADVIYLFHPDVPVHTLSRYSDGWRFERVEFKDGPFRDFNVDEDKKMTLTMAGGTYFLTSTWDFFVPAMVGDLVKLEMNVKPRSGEFTLSTVGATVLVTLDGGGPAYFYGPYNWRTSGKWVGTIKVERCTFEGWSGKSEGEWEWEEIKTYSSEADAEENFAYSGVVEEYATLFRFTLVDSGGGTKPTVAWDFEGGVLERIVKIISVTDSRTAVVSVYDKIPGGVEETDAWAVSAFGALYGYPALGIFHQERLVLARTNADKQTIWMSQPASWHNFGTSVPTQDDDALMVALASKQVNEIRGLASRGDLLIFTSGGEWTAKAGAKTDVFTPSSMIITPSGYRGSHSVPVLDVGNITLFAQRHGTTIRAFGYSLDIDGYSSTDVSVLASHILENNPVVAWDYQQTPWSVVWMVLTDGTMAAITLQQEHQVQAWSRHIIGGGGKVRDVCCIPGQRQDDVYIALERNGSMRVERLRERTEEIGCFLDAGGYIVESKFESLEWELPANGTLQGRHKFIPVVTLRLLKTLGFQAGIVTENNEALDELQFPDASYPGSALTPFTGDVRLVARGGSGRKCIVKIFNDKLRPITLLGMFPEVVIPDAASD
jgi:hypothetical protein